MRPILKTGSLIGLAGIAAAMALLGADGRAQEPRTMVIRPEQARMFDRGSFALGVGTHLASRRALGYEPASVARAIGALGFNALRDDVVWNPAAADLGAAPSAKLRAALDAGYAAPLLVLNGQAGGPANAPQDAAARARYAAFAVRAVGATIGRANTFELWNEWNRNADIKAPAMKTEGAPDDPRYSGKYALFAREATAAIKARYPRARVLVGAAADDPQWSWLTDVVRKGGLTGADGLSVHLYNQCNRRIRGADELIARLRSLQQQMRPIVGRAVPIYVTEWGWSTGTTCQIDSDFVAANSAQFLFGAAALPWVKGTWRYELKDQGGDPANLETSFGVLKSDYTPKPSTCALRAAVTLLRSARTIARVQTPDGVTAILLSTGREAIAVLWSSPGHDGASARLASAGRAEPMCGPARPVAAGQPIPIGAMPVAVHLGRPTNRVAISTG